MGQWSLRVWDFRPKDKQVGSIPFQQTPFVDWRGPWICAARDKTARGVALCWTYKSWARQCQLSKRTAQLSKVSPSLSLCLLSLLFIFFSASELLSARTQTIQFLFISPLHSSSSPTPATQHLPRLPHPPSHLSLFTPLRISPLAIKTHSSPCCRPNSPPRCLFPFLILASTSLSPPFGFN